MIERVETLEREHDEADRWHTEVDRLGQAWLAAGTLSQTDVARFSRLATDLTELYRTHIAIEEREVFPAAAAVLGKAEFDAVGTEMAARRGLQGRPSVTLVTAQGTDAA